MTRRVAILLAALMLSGAARAQSMGSGIWSGMPSGLGGGFSGSIGSGVTSGFGMPDAGRRARIDDFTLGGTGELRPGVLRGQPTNFGPSYQALNALGRQTLPMGDGPAMPLDFTAGGPAGPLD